MSGKPAKELTRAERMDRHNRHEAYAEQILEMFVRGESYRAIERATGVPKSTAAHMCKRLGAEYVTERYGDHTTILGRELNILDQLTRTNLQSAKHGDKASADIVLNSHIRRSRLLGLEAAVKAEITVRTSTDIEIERLVSMLTYSSEETSEPEEPRKRPESAQKIGGSLGYAEGPESAGDANVGGLA